MASSSKQKTKLKAKLESRKDGRLATECKREQLVSTTTEPKLDKCFEDMSSYPHTYSYLDRLSKAEVLLELTVSGLETKIDVYERSMGLLSTKEKVGVETARYQQKIQGLRLLISQARMRFCHNMELLQAGHPISSLTVINTNRSPHAAAQQAEQIWKDPEKKEDGPFSSFSECNHLRAAMKSPSAASSGLSVKESEDAIWISSSEDEGECVPTDLVTNKAGPITDDDAEMRLVPEEKQVTQPQMSNATVNLSELKLPAGFADKDNFTDCQLSPDSGVVAVVNGDSGRTDNSWSSFTSSARSFSSDDKREEPMEQVIKSSQSQHNVENDYRLACQLAEEFTSRGALKDDYSLACQLSEEFDAMMVIEDQDGRDSWSTVVKKSKSPIAKEECSKVKVKPPPKESLFRKLDQRVECNDENRSSTICRSYKQLGYCTYGEGCKFSHKEPTDSTSRPSKVKQSNEEKPVKKFSPTVYHTVKGKQYKTMLCKSFELGNCPLSAADCNYAHDIKDLDPALQHEEPCSNQFCLGRLRYEKCKTQLCPYRGTARKCKWLPDCKYAHSEKELRPLPKRELCQKMFGPTRKCFLNEQCPYAHTKKELYAPRVASKPSSGRPKPSDSLATEQEQVIMSTAVVQDKAVDDDSECYICKEPLVRGSRKKLDCPYNHDCWHLQCIKKWVDDRSSTCPLCRETVSQISTMPLPAGLHPQDFPRLAVC